MLVIFEKCLTCGEEIHPNIPHDCVKAKMDDMDELKIEPPDFKQRLRGKSPLKESARTHRNYDAGDSL